MEILKQSNSRAPIFRILFSLLIAGGTFILIRWGIIFMRDEEAPERLMVNLFKRLGWDSLTNNLVEDGLNPLTGKIMIASVALLLGVAGIWVLFWVANNLLEQLPQKVREWLRPAIFVGPAFLLLTTYLIYPALNTVYLSLTEDIVGLADEIPDELASADQMAIALAATKDNIVFGNYLIDTQFFELANVSVTNKNDVTKSQTIWLIIDNRQVTTIGLQNYLFAFTSPEMHIAFRNNLLWLIVGTGGSVILGLLIATFVDRIKREALAKSFIFLPLAISSVGASVIWKFVYAWQPPGREQIGLLNAIVTSFEIEPIPWIIKTPLNTYALIVIMIWLQTGFAMVVLSAALKGIPNEVIEASRIDGASEFQLFFRIILPMIRGSMITVGTTIFIAILKVFDIVYVMTSGRFDTEVIANRMFIEMFTFRNFGRASALAFILLVVVVPIMVLNIRNLRQQGINR